MLNQFAHKVARVPIDGAGDLARKGGSGPGACRSYAEDAGRAPGFGAGFSVSSQTIVLVTDLASAAMSSSKVNTRGGLVVIIAHGPVMRAAIAFADSPPGQFTEDIVMNPIVKFVLPVFLLAGSPAPASAESAEEKGLAIAVEADRRDSGFGDNTAELIMVLRNRHGEESIRDMRAKTLEVDGDGDKNLTLFDRPADVKGTALLTYTHKTDDDDQWLFLPALKRVKRIASNNKSGPFMGSEFAYEDIASQEVEKYTYKYLRNEMLDGEEMFVLERYPVDRKSGYTRQVVWMDTAEYRARKIDYYDRKDSLLKTLTFEGYRQYLDKYWRADEMVMINHQTGKSTRLSWKNYRFSTGLTDRDFDRNALKRAR
jgi:outer membrane lipoprotein-sorting protein